MHMDDIRKWRDLIAEVTPGQTAINQTITRITPGMERQEDLYKRSDSYSNLTTVADLLQVLQAEIDKALPLVQNCRQDSVDIIAATQSPKSQKNQQSIVWLGQEEYRHWHSRKVDCCSRHACGSCDAGWLGVIQHQYLHLVMACELVLFCLMRD